MWLISVETHDILTTFTRVGLSVSNRSMWLCFRLKWSLAFRSLPFIYLPLWFFRYVDECPFSEYIIQIHYFNESRFVNEKCLNERSDSAATWRQSDIGSAQIIIVVLNHAIIFNSIVIREYITFSKWSIYLVEILITLKYFTLILALHSYWVSLIETIDVPPSGGGLGCNHIWWFFRIT